MLDAARLVYKGQAAAQPDFNPAYRYLRTQVGDRTLFMVLGYIDQRAEGPVEVWYSGSGEIVRLLNGQLVGTTGLSTDWRNVRFTGLPAWPTPDATRTSGGSGQSYTRLRDLMPGYRFGIRDEIVRTPISPPQNTFLAGANPASLRWYEERSVSRPSTASLPAARFGISSASGAPQVVYSEQCLTSDFCMSFEQWTPSSPAAGRSASSGT
ncbi:hypothetical protein J2W28_000515 [Variovorax boronicumulans]|uniref:YjbF family lipoprotein n=1 Tax=Variovorax boronicumulans TaxID=436515 RepID=UPI002781A46F|nr:YjbF family lipoprotein [Variovorax boronicumulans]MDP9990105.1 hypothetical protein [Variovorax boronicumulans]MDQ0001387.1 hypothetical protein [Variovorax boronicumulans]